MDEIRFDRLARAIGSRASRRAALVALAGAGLGGALGLAGTEDAAAKCSHKKPCASLCAKCKRGKCKKLKEGSTCAEGGGTCHDKQCVCPSESYACPPAARCCENGQACLRDSTSCAASCPAAPDACTQEGVPLCGQYGPGAEDLCGCVTSVDDANICSSLYFACFDCQSDQDCVDEFGAPSACIDISGGCVDCPTSTICIYGACGVPPSATSARRDRFRRGALKVARR